jgi:hypothetical protein
MRSGSELVLTRVKTDFGRYNTGLDGSGAGSGSAPFVYLIVRVCTIGRYIFNAEQLSEWYKEELLNNEVQRTKKSGKFFHPIQFKYESNLVLKKSSICFKEKMFWLFQLASKLKPFSSKSIKAWCLHSHWSLYRPLKIRRIAQKCKTPVSYSSLILKLTAQNITQPGRLFTERRALSRSVRAT